MSVKCLKFAANLSTMFPNPFLERFAVAKKKGFQYVEIQSPYDQEVYAVERAKRDSGLAVTLINTPTRTSAAYLDHDTFGVACIPGLELDYCSIIDKAIIYANNLKCDRIHIISGLKVAKFTLLEMKTQYIANLTYAAERLSEDGIMAVIEPMCPAVKPNYFLDSFDLAIECIDAVRSANHENIFLLLDIYHLQMIEKSVENLEKYLPYAGHIQISQAPHRNEPFSSGDIDYKKVFSVLQKNNYSKPIGLEYTPTNQEESFKWLEEYGIQQKEM